MKKFLLLLVSVLSLASSVAETAPAKMMVDTIYHPPVGKSRDVAILMLGGSEGGFPDYYDTKGFTEKGYACLVAGYFRTPHTTDRLELIPLEYFEAVIEQFRARPEVGNKKLVVWGGSKGGELALLLASRYPQINGVIAAVPSSVVFQGIGGQRVSSWSYKGESIPFVPYADYDFSKIVNNEYVEAYRLSLEQKEFVEKATIPVENINGPVLILSGKADTMWPSSQMGAMIEKRLREKQFKHGYRHVSYEDAGHTLNDGYMMGGTAEGNRKARDDVKKQVDEFLERLAGGS
ncbi:MAG: acyl-CoA thioester hydrolase/BAAT C-terminal domain-containing protein [Nibricoccus sp.]